MNFPLLAVNEQQITERKHEENPSRQVTHTSPLANASGAVRAMSTHNTNQRPYATRKGNKHNKARRLASITEREQKRARRNHSRTVAEWYEDVHSD